MVKRSGWVTGVVVVQFLCGLLLLGTCIFLLFMMRDPGVAQSDDGGAAVHD